MRLIVYDNAPGPGSWQGFLRSMWVAGAQLQKSTGAADAYFGANTWAEAFAWLQSHPVITSLQFFGHGGPAAVYCGGIGITSQPFIDALKLKVTPSTLIWFRCCSLFQGKTGQLFSERMADRLGCVIA